MIGDLFGDAMMKVQELSIKLHRKHDHDTSIGAAIAIAPKLNEIQLQVMAYANNKPNGFTDVDLNKFFNCTSSTFRTRRKELVEKGLIANSWKRERVNGRMHIVWISKEFL
jgi:hypothetical protein